MRVAQTECAVTEEALARHDVDLPFVFIDGEMHPSTPECLDTGIAMTSLTR